MALNVLPQEFESKQPRSMRRILDAENPKVIIELTKEKVNLVEFVEYVLNFEDGAESK